MMKNQGIYTQRLLSLPSLNDLNDLSIHTRLSHDLISKYVSNNKRYYHHFNMTKRSGGVRPIENPDEELKAIQRWILRNILDKLFPSIYAKGFVKKMSILNNAKPHLDHQYILNIDLKDFFSHVKASHVFTVFNALGYSKMMSYYLTSICTLNGYLPQGAPTSPSLSNFVCLRLDHRIGKYCENKALSYTRYADDICISGNKLTVIKDAWHMLRVIIESEGFIINSKKEKLSGPKSRREVTGLIVNPSLGIGRSKYNYYRKKIFILLMANDPKREQIISGILSYVKSVDAKRHIYLCKYYDSIKLKASTSI
ncbi:TPA: retron St85 family RNA-directed DNA polymerase [Yersinia enterocolitica]|uniref:retron St85 family RNA-directed DNA polymerase n=1 Tax=Yersinia enterocolitica TaxID=630 RepID=UPI0005DF8F90|nr:retron St85 family RNA-directed DNA polymerase [Yersinia enterocolitica]CQH31748.1 Retron-type reverse transcriptase [Yersinia enterocolitica]CQI12217.1 Retron-type reverse transcriptase [Yersinia enterocolitica]HDL6906288.1 retron St85 family RNA-directed DNA polymerase [Yersinia enterocolitica]HDL6910926.1 retron St85 family RNA-directed DNA polymerase [Yersinia enterocolitica]HDL7029270.1 retron St85 family RNA-directed DNA polymerase [Yersinia enterocolitica]